MIISNSLSNAKWYQQNLQISSWLNHSIEKQWIFLNNWTAVSCANIYQQKKFKRYNLFRFLIVGKLFIIIIYYRYCKCNILKLSLSSYIAKYCQDSLRDRIPFKYICENYAQELKLLEKCLYMLRLLYCGFVSL